MIIHFLSSITSTNFLDVVMPAMIRILSLDVTKYVASLSISSLFALFLSGLDFNDIDISFPSTWIFQLELNLTKILYLKSDCITIMIN